ncbi:mRNA decay activator protein ZFP36L1-like [Homarus americanus]|uniref:mRNA decay activator protein ZFP36L1-like n=2 Tax=Homarus americanus TaxID=6706 RepID=A0A8J5JJS5_HOMAM|nr:mRNA decay activator protein ZFP36L1-like [Homarus americanus]
MGSRRNSGRSVGNSSLLGRNLSDRKNLPRTNQTTATNRLLRASPVQHSIHIRHQCPRRQPSPVRSLKPVHNSNQPCEYPWSIDNHNDYMLEEDRGTFPPCSSPSDPTCSGTDNGSISCSRSAIRSSDGTSNTRKNGSSKKVDRPMPARPSNPLRYKTELCRTYEESGNCKFAKTCTFAHGLRELRAVPRHPRYKTDLCRTYHSLGYCQYGARCHFVHDPEEAAGVSSMRGLRLRSRHDRLGSALLTLAEIAGVAPDPTASDVLLANLRRLYAIRTMQDDSENRAASTDIGTGIQHGNTMDLTSCSNPVSVDLSKLLPENISAMLLEPVSSRRSVSESFTGSSVLDNSLDHLLECSVDENVDSSMDTGVWSSASSMSTSWGCGSTTLTPPLSPDSDNTWQPLPSILSDFPFCDIDQTSASKLVQVQCVISNPMEVSRSLQLPTIAELCHLAQF